MACEVAARRQLRAHVDCLAGARWEKASELFEQMQQNGCRPDSVTYAGLLAALERGGHWRRALKAFEQMQAQACHPDAAVFNSLFEVLWQSGVLLAQAKALQLWMLANRSGHFRCGPLARTARSPTPRAACRGPCCAQGTALHAKPRCGAQPDATQRHAPRVCSDQMSASTALRAQFPLRCVAERYTALIAPQDLCQ